MEEQQKRMHDIRNSLGIILLRAELIGCKAVDDSIRSKSLTSAAKAIQVEVIKIRDIIEEVQTA